MITLIEFIRSVIIGIVQGISEWLPISSKTQIIISSQYLLNLTYSQAYTFGLFMEVGTILAAIIYFRKDVIKILKALVGRGSRQDRNLLIYVIIATVVTGIIGVPLYLIADSITGVVAGIPMLVIGAVLIVDSIVIRYSRKRVGIGNGKKFDKLSVRDYLLIGGLQGVSALPGVSRSGITTSALLVLGIEPDEAFRLSFLIGIFATSAAFAMTVLISRANVVASLAGMGIEGLVVATIVATIISLLLIDFLIKIAGKAKIVYVTAGLGILAIAFGFIYLIFHI
ncbi:MAG: undecaprenyl-diphosphate phosphatase [Candidatus Marsarchaeota archaeon]|nr:undecaprenyl-diphosphate phosphatase [Candidatus Marsarchaeota archaeon]